MSDGGEERNRDAEQNAKKKLRPEDFSRAVARVAVAQLSEGVGFEGVKQSAIDALSNIALRYICDLGKSAKYYAEIAGRSETNVFDVIKGLEDLSSTRGFSGASEVSCSATESGALNDIMDYVSNVEEIPFARPIPQFPVSRSSSKMMQRFTKQGESSSKKKHIPDWLPVFPEPHEYSNSPIFTKKTKERERDADNALLRLQQKNQFLNPPLPGGEKEVSEIAVPTRLVSMEGNREDFPFVEIIAPAINQTRDDGELDSTDTERRLPLEGRPVVHFRLKTGKKMVREDVGVGLRGGDEDCRDLALDRRDEKKRRAEQILQQAVINPQDTSQNVN